MKENLHKEITMKRENCSYPYAYGQSYAPKGRGWRLESSTVEKCSQAPDNATISISEAVYDKIAIALDEMGSLEWLGYLIGDVDGTKAKVEDIIIPDQEVTAGSAKVLETPEEPRIIGTVHSHGGGGGAFSDTDESFIMANHPVSLLAGKGETRGVIRVRLPCGSYALVKAVVSVNVPDNQEFREVLREKIKSKTLALGQMPLRSNWGPGNLPYGDEDWGLPYV